MKKIIILLSILIFVTGCQDDSDSQNTNQPTQSTPNYATDSSSNKEFKYSELSPFKILSITEGIYESAPTLQINLSLPVKSNFSENITVTHKNQRVNGDWIISDSGLSLYFPFIEANQKYLIDVNSQLTSINGKLIDKAYQKSINTRAAQTRVRFLTGGHTLLKNSNQLPIEAVNVDKVDLKFWKIKTEKYQEFLRYPNYRDSYSLNKLKEKADLIYTGQFALDSVKNKTEVHNISLRGIPELEGHGLYFVTMIPSSDYPYEYQTSWFAITDIGIQTRSFKNSIAVFTHKIPDASVYRDVQLTLYNNKNEVIHQTKTDQTGFAEFNISQLKANTNATLIVARKGHNTNIIRLNSAKMDLSDFSLSSRAYKSQELFLYAPRDLYRPGETVHINGLLRNDDGQMVSASPVRVEIKRPDNRVFKTLNWQGDESAFYTSSFKVPEDALTGTWRFTAKLANNDYFEYMFAVEDFLPERLKLELQAGNESEHIGVNEIPKVKVQSDYLYGAPASKNRFDATVTVSTNNKLFEEFEDYSFGSNHYRDYNLNFTTKPQTLDENGYGELTIKPNWAQAKFPLKISSFVSVYESGGRPIARKFKQSVWPYDVAIGVRSLWKGNYANPNQNNGIELLAVNRQGEKVSLDNVEVLLIRENYNRYWHWGDDGWSYNRGEKNIPVYSSLVNINADEPETLSLPLEYGTYRVELRHQQQLISSHQFFSGWTWYDPEFANAQRPDQVKLLWNKDSLSAGENAELKITAPYAGTALITVESDKMLWKKTIQMNSAEQSVQIPIDSNWNRHDIHASVMVIRSGDIKRKNLPTRSFGIIHLPLNREDRKLDLVIDHPEKILPDQKVTIKVKANNLASNDNSYLTLAAVDTGVLNVSNFKTPDPFAWFFEKRKYLVAIHDMYASIIALKDGKNTHLNFGGDADLTHGGEAPKSEVQIVSLFSEKVSFNGDGEAEIEFEMPYFNGEVRLMALAFNDNQFASAESPMKIAAPIVIETSMPRFLAKGDKTNATIDVHNTENTQQTIDIKIQASDSLNAEVIEQQLVLEAQQKQIIQLPLVSQIHAGLGHVEINASSQQNADFKMNRIWSIGLRPAYPAITKKTEQMISNGKVFAATEDTFAGFDNTGLQSVLKVSNAPLLNADEQIKHLIAYPYGCLEQTSSRAWPLLSVEKSDLALLAGAQQSKIFDQRVDLINGAISRLLGMQRYDGSFGLWNNNSNEEYWLTVYVTDFMLKAQSLGYTVPEKSLSKAVNRLQTYVRGRNNINSELSQYLSHVNHFKLSYQAYAAYVLSSINRANLADIRKLYDSYSVNAKSPLPLTHLAISLEKLGDSKRANEAWLKVIDFKWQQNRYSYYGDYGSKIRDLSQIILLAQTSQLADDLPKSMMTFIEPLQKEIYQRRWLSTQERSAIFKLAKALKSKKDLGVDWQALLTISESKESLSQSQDYTQKWYDDEASRNFSLTNTGSDPLFVNFTTQGYLKEAKPESHGIEVQRRFFNIQGDRQDLTQLKTGDMVLVHLMLKTDKEYKYLPDAMIIDLLPAGLELENQNLEHSFKLDDIKVDGKTISQWRGYNYLKHQEFRDDRYVAALALNGYRDNHVFYLARAVTPGEYTVPPTLVEDMYRPEIRAVGKEETKLIIKE